VFNQDTMKVVSNFVTTFHEIKYWLVGIDRVNNIEVVYYLFYFLIIIIMIRKKEIKPTQA